MPAATSPVPVPPLEPGRPPLAILVDYDGTIARTDVSDALMAPYVTPDWEARVADYDAGRVGSRGLMEWEIGLITADPDALSAEAAAQPHDDGFAPFVRRARAAGIPVEVVSDGFGFFIEPALAALGLPDVAVVTARTSVDRGRPRIDFPNGHPHCFVCGTCKRNRVLAHQAAGRAVVFVGDGASDRYAAGYSDIVFAKHQLAALCVENRWPFRRWTEFSEIDHWLVATLDAWRRDPSSLGAPSVKPFFCGPEVWGEGRWDPPSPAPADEGVAPG
jgi:2-hydroxy-3-keto-5-methylthiopentenyl-1-phosphate phosphatase